MKKKMQWLQKLRLYLYIPKISCQRITQSTYSSFACSSHITPSPVTFQTDQVYSNIDTLIYLQKERKKERKKLGDESSKFVAIFIYDKSMQVHGYSTQKKKKSE